MEDKLVEFANLLRQNGIRVSLAETLDAVAASDVTGLGEREMFRAALRATMIKRASELPVFEELFDVYFSGLGEIIKGASKEVQDALSMSDQDFQDFLDQMEEMLKNHGEELSELAKQLLQNNNGQIERAMREAARAVRMQGIQRTIEENYFARALARALGFDKIEQEIKELREQLEKLDLGAGMKAKMEEYLDRRLKMLEDIIRKYVRQEREKRDMKAREEQRMNQLGDKSFYYLSDEELDRMKEAVSRLAQRLKNALAVRRKHAKKDRFDIKRTLRQNLEYGGVPFKLRFEKRRREKPQVVILCDVSDSVRNASRLMLLFMYTLQSLFHRVRSFAFVSDIGELTAELREADARRAIDLALAGKVVSLYANSNYGRALALFAREHLGAVTRRTTVLVIGDGRNNYNPPNEWALEDIRRKARRLVWISPEPRSSWGLGDSEMHRYGRHVSQLAVVTSLADLARLAEEIVPA